MSGTSHSGQRPAPSARRPPRISAERVRLVVVAVVVGLAGAFIVLNTQEVSVDWIVTTTKTPLIVVILVSLALGGIFVAAALGARRRSARRKRRAASAERSHLADQ
ncbi:MAG: lipopolysaccharide assembly protein LapA domain-containing protein [Solirubrobacteraceae bacterium]